MNRKTGSKDHEPTTTMTKNKPVVRLKPVTYQPAKAELEEDVSIDTTPENLAKVALRPVTIKTIGGDE